MKTNFHEKAVLDEYIAMARSGRFDEYVGVLTLWWLSFADDDGFRGACIVLGTDVVTATQSAHALGISPGGQVLGLPIPLDTVREIDPDDIGVLMDLDRCREFDRKMLARKPS